MDNPAMLGPRPAAAPVASTSASAMAAGAGAPMANFYEIRLTKPIMTHGGQVSVLKFREPVASDYIETGSLPFDIAGAGDEKRMKVDFKQMGKWVSRLTGIDMILIGNLSNADWMNASAKVVDVLLDVGVQDTGNSTS